MSLSTLRGAPSRRDTHKKRTRRSLRNAALKLFATKGFDATTTEEIAQEAGVSARTLFRYFPTKESVLFSGERAWIQSFTEAYLHQPETLSDLDAICATLVALAPSLIPRRTSLRLYTRAVASSPTLRGREQDHQREDVEEVAEAIAVRRGLPQADEAATLLAAVSVMTYVRALNTWLAGPASADVGQVISEEFALLAEPFAEAQGKRKRRPAVS